MNGFAGCAIAVEQLLTEAVKVMNLFHVVHLAAENLTGSWQRLQRATTGCRGRKNDPLYKHRRILLARTSYLANRHNQ